MADSENGDLSKMCEFEMEFAQGNENSDLADAINITWGSLAIGSKPTSKFQVGDWVCVVGDSVCRGSIGKVIEQSNGKFMDHFVDFANMRWWYSADDLRHATPQEIAHIYAQEICDAE
jgi:hypothetical protein